MKHVRARKGPFIARPYYTDQEIENICQDELQAHNLMPERPSAIRIDRFIEKKFDVVHSYEVLGDGVLGLTQFGRTGVSAIIVSRSLEEDGTQAAEGRVRSTLAHEAGHGLLHAHLFVLQDQQPLFGDSSDPSGPKILCRNEIEKGIEHSYSGEWWEYHANKAIGALLMPAKLVEIALRDQNFLIVSGGLSIKAFDHSKMTDASKYLASVFNVNPAVSRLRLNQLYPLGARGQMTL